MTDGPEAFVEAFREGWRNPAGADGFVAGFLPHLDPQIRLLQPQMPVAVGVEAFRRASALLAAVARRPGAWPRFARLRYRQLRARQNKRKGAR